MSTETQDFGDQLEVVIDGLHDLEDRIIEVLSHAQDMKSHIQSIFSMIRSNGGEVHEIDFDSELESIEDVMGDITYEQSSIDMSISRVRDAKSELDNLVD